MSNGLMRRWALYGIAGVFLAVLSGCAALEEAEKTTPEPEDKFDFIRRNDQQKFAEQEEPLPELVGDEPAPGVDELKARAEKLSSAEPKKSPADEVRHPAPAPRYYEDFITIDGDEELEVMLTFNSAPLVDTLPAFADVLGFNFTADSEIKNTVTLNLNSRMTRRELWEAFDNMLRVAGVGAVRDGQLLKIMPAAKIPTDGGLRVRNRYDGGSEVVSRSLFNITAKDAAAQLKPFLSKAGSIAEVTRANVIVFSDEAGNIAKLNEILELLDQPGRQLWPRIVVYCENIKPSKIAQELSEILPVIGFPVTLTNDKTETPGAIQLTGVDRIGILAATAANAEALDELREWIEILDNADSGEQERMYIYKVAHGKADELAQALSVIFSTQGSSLTVDTSTGTNRTEQITTQTVRNNNLNTGSSVNDRNSTNNQTNTQIDRVSAVFDTPVRVFADGVNNRLVIRTTPRTYAMIKAMLDRLDVVPAQVLLQILVVEVTLNDSNEFGLEFNTTGSAGSTGVSTGTNFSEIDRGNAEAEGFNLGIFDENNPEDKFAYLRALAGRENIKVISSPQLVVVSNTEAIIQVGQEVPLLTNDITNVDSADGSISRAYEYESTGILLTITPQVTSSNLISLELRQEVSEAVANTITNASETPVINMRILETAMSIANGRTMVIGGMIQEKITDKLQSIPFVADIPFMRRLFGNTNQSVERTEMLILITGYIINEKSPVEDMVRRYNNAVKALSLFEGAIAEEDARDRQRAAEAAARPRLEPLAQEQVSAQEQAEK